MKRIFKIFSSFIAVAFLLMSCEDNRLDGMCEDQVYFLNANEEQVFYVSKRDYADVSFTIYKSGIGNTAASVEVIADATALDQYNEKHGTNYKMLDENCYTINQTHFDFGAKDVSFTSSIEFDGQAIASFQGLAVKDHVVPLTLNSNGAVSEKLGVLLLVPVLEN